MKAKICHIFGWYNKLRRKTVPRWFRYDIVEDYGDSCNGHLLHTWDDGKRILVRCRMCGCYVLIQRSEFHSFTDAPDAYYIDYFAVSDPEEARMLNQKYNGSQLELEFEGPHIFCEM